MDGRWGKQTKQTNNKLFATEDMPKLRPVCCAYSVSTESILCTEYTLGLAYRHTLPSAPEASLDCIFTEEEDPLFYGATAQHKTYSVHKQKYISYPHYQLRRWPEVVRVRVCGCDK